MFNLEIHLRIARGLYGFGNSRSSVGLRVYLHDGRQRRTEDRATSGGSRSQARYVILTGSPPAFPCYSSLLALNFSIAHNLGFFRLTSLHIATRIPPACPARFFIFPVQAQAPRLPQHSN